MSATTAPSTVPGAEPLPPTYRIRNWDDSFETSESRKVKRLDWVAVPTDLQSTGLIELITGHPNGEKHVGAWLVILELAATCSPRGTLVRESGKPHTVRTIANATRFSEATIAETIQRACVIGWMEAVGESPGESAGDLPVDRAIPPEVRENAGESRENISAYIDIIHLTSTSTLKSEEKSSACGGAGKPRKPRKTKPSATETPPDPRVNEVKREWNEAYKLATGSDYPFDHGRDGRVAKAILAQADAIGVDAAEIVRRMTFFHRDKFWGGKKLSDFASQFAAFAVDRSNGGKPQRFTPADPLFAGLTDLVEPASIFGPFATTANGALGFKGQIETRVAPLRGAAMEEKETR